MKILKKIFNFYIYSSLHVAVAVFCLVNLTNLTNHLDKHFLFPTCVFFGTIVGYNFLKYNQVFINRNIQSNKFYPILVVSLLAVFGFLFLLFFLNFAIQKLILLSGFFVLTYPFLRKWGWLKLFFVSFVVTFITVYIPFQTIKWLPLEFYISLIQRFFILISLLVPFEIMDSKTDDKTLNTLPQLFGVFRTKLIGILLVVLFIVLEFIKIHPSYFVLPIGIVTAILICFTKTDRNQYYTSFWVESVPVLWWILLLFFKNHYF